ncbi:MAG TPA: hypothetical protein VJC04_02995 [Candidatus Paceibacterota bacterium]
MGKLEQSVKRKIRLAKIQKVILSTIAILGVLSSPMAAARILKELRLGGWKETKRNPRYTISDSLKNLLQFNLIYFEETQKGKFLRLTKEGENYLRLYTELGRELSKPKRWDGKWRIVIFDIREERKTLREKLRNTLNAIGFVHLQHSVWVYPYDCEDFITILKADFKVGKDILYIIADKIENDFGLRQHFGLLK